MTSLSPQDEQAVDRLSFFMLKQAYSAVAILLRKLDPATAQCMFLAIEKQMELALQNIHAEQLEGPASSAIATAIAETLVEVLDEPHRSGEGVEARVANVQLPAVDVSGIVLELRRQAA